MSKISLKRIIKNIKYLLKNDLSEKEKEILFEAKDGAVDDCVYELEEDKKILKNLIILDDKESIDVLLSNPKSFARFGDGEIQIIQGKNCSFQKYNPMLADKLLKLLTEKREDVYVGLNRSYFHSPMVYSENNHKFYRIYGTSFRHFFLNHCDPSNVYLDACLFGGYFRLAPNYDFKKLYERNMLLFKDKKIAVVAGKGVLSQLKYDVFSLAKEKVVIEAPSINAFDKYDEIIETINKKVDKSFIVCLILGQTATVMAGDLANMGYIAWDIGHLPKDYDAYMSKVERNPDNAKKFFGPDL